MVADGTLGPEPIPRRKVGQRRRVVTGGDVDMQSAGPGVRVQIGVGCRQVNAATVAHVTRVPHSATMLVRIRPDRLVGPV